MNAPVVTAAVPSGGSVPANAGVVLPAVSAGTVTTAGMQLGDLYIGVMPNTAGGPVADAATATTLIGSGGGLFGTDPSFTSYTGGAADSIMTIGAGPLGTSVTGGAGDSIMTIAEGPSGTSVTGGGGDSIMTIAEGPSTTSVTGGGPADSIMTVAEGPSATSFTGGASDSILTIGLDPSAPTTSFTGGASDSILDGVTTGTGTAGGGGTAAIPGLTMTSVGSGGSAADAALVEGALTLLGTSATGADEVDRLRRAGAHVDVLSAAEFTARGESNSHAYFDPKTNVLYVRREDLQSDTKLAAVEIAHEGAHLLDYVGKVSDAFNAPQLATIATLGATQAAEAVKQLQFENMMINESRAFLYAGQVARDLGWTGPAADPTSTAQAGGNDAATYAKVWQQLLDSPYNTDHRTASVTMV